MKKDIIKPPEHLIQISSLEAKSQPSTHGCDNLGTKSLSHDGKQIDRVVVSLDMSYIVTYSKEENSIVGWSNDIEGDGTQQEQQYDVKEKRLQPDVKFFLDEPYQISSFLLYKRILLFYPKVKVKNNHYHYYRLVDLNSANVRFLKLNHEKIDSVEENSMGFLPNGDLIQVLLKDYKIYLYSFQDKPSNSTIPWKYSQTFEIEIPKSLNQSLNSKDEYINCYVFQTAKLTKLFISTTTKFHKYDSVTTIFQFRWDLSKMTFDSETQYNLSNSYKTMNLNKSLSKIVINKTKTLLALNVKEIIYIFSMETGIQISRNTDDHEPIEFVTLK